MEESFLEQLFDQKILKILQLFFNDEEKELYLLEISKKSGVPAASTYRIINRLVDMKVLELVRINKFKLYRLSKGRQADALKSILKKDRKMLDLFVERIREVPGVTRIILHGKESKNKANVLLIGEDIDSTFVKSITYELKSKYGFRVSSLNLTPDQYEQMSKMGLYSGEKRTLFMRAK